MRYQPRLRNGKLVKLSWTLALFRRSNPGGWPLDDYSTDRDRFLEKALFVSTLVIFCCQFEANLQFLLSNIKDMDRLITAVPQNLIQTEVIIRFIHLDMHKDQLKTLFEHFFSAIYVPQESDQARYLKIKRKLLGPWMMTGFYLVTLLNYIYEFLMNIIKGRYDMFYKQEYFFDTTILPVYIILNTMNLCLGVLIVTMIFGDLNIIAELLMHLNTCYLELHRDIKLVAAELLNSDDTTNIAAKYRRELIKILTRNMDLNRFAIDMEKQFTFRLFISYSFSALILCVLLFISYKNPAESVFYIFWFASKFIEQLIFGYLGSIIHETTNGLDLLYYCGDWEQIIYCSDNVQENVKLMRLIALSMELNSKAFCLTGLKYFPVNLQTAVKILQGAFSYFTFLKSMG